MAEITPEQLQEIYGRYADQHAPTGYAEEIQALGYQPQYVSGKVPTFQFGSNVLGDYTTGVTKTGELEQQSFAERSGLATSGTATNAYSYFDESRGVQVHAAPGYHFELYPGGGVKQVSGLIAASSPTEGAPASSLFTQGTQGVPGGAEGQTQATPGFTQDQLSYAPIEGKTIQSTGQTVFNPTTGVDEHAGPGEVLIQYTDGTVERRKFGAAPGSAVPVGEFGQTPEQLGITNKTEIKNAEGGVAQAPQTETVEQMLARGASQQEIEARIAAEGTLAPTSNLEFIGTNYTDQKTGVQRTAKDGYAFYQEPGGGTILERPIALQSLAKQTTSASVLAERAKAKIAGAATSLSDDLMANLGDLGFDMSGADDLIQALRDRPIPSVQELYTQIQTAQGVPTIQAQIKTIQDEMKSLDDKFADDKAGIDENPWLSETLRNRKQDALFEKYDTKRSQLVARQQLFQSLLQDARQEAQFLAGSAVEQANADRAFDMQALQLAFERADQRLQAQIQLQNLALNQEELDIRREESAADRAFQEQQFQEEVRQFNEQFSLSSAKEARIGSGGGGSGGSVAGTSSGSITGLKQTADTSGEIRQWIIANKRANPTMSYYDLWGNLASEMANQGLNPDNYDKVFWEVLHPEGLEGYDKYVKQQTATSSGGIDFNEF